MPHVHITMYPGRSDEVKKDLAIKVQKLLADELHIDNKVISVSIEDIPKEQWADTQAKIPLGTIFIKPTL